SFSAHMPAAGNLALISQSGAIAAGMVDWAAQRAVGFSGIVSIGDQLDVDIADLLDYFALDRDTGAILLYVEAIKDARKFMSAARAAARIKPVVVVKSGRMAQGAKAAATHTGALAGSDAVYDAAFQRAGVLRVSDLRELFDCAETLGRLKSPPGKRLAILTNGGGIGVLAVDRLAELGGIPAAMTPAVRQKLDAVLPPTWSGSNPVDIIGDADPARYAAALEVLLADPDNDAVLVMNVQTAIARADEIAAAVTGVVQKYRAEHRMRPKPVLAVWVGADQSIGVASGLVVRNTGAAQQVADRLIRPDPDRKYRLGPHAMFGAILLDHTGHGCGDLIGTRDRCLDIHDQHGIIVRGGQQHFERRGIAR